MHGGADGQGDVSHDDIRLETDEFLRQGTQAVVSTQLVTPVDDEVLSFDVAELTKALPESVWRPCVVGSVQIQQDTEACRLARPGLSMGGQRCRGGHGDEHCNERRACAAYPASHCVKRSWIRAVWSASQTVSDLIATFAFSA